MSKFTAGVLIVLHGLVHLQYFGQSLRLFELQPGMVWPESSWVFSKLLGDEATRTLASIACILAGVGFMAGDIGTLVEETWWHPFIAGTAAFSTGLLILFWNGGSKKLDKQGGLACL